MKIKKGRRRWVPYAQRIFGFGFGLGSELGLVEDFVRIRTTPTFNLLFLKLSLYLPLPSPTRTHSLPHIAPTLLYFPKFPLQKTYLFLCSSSLSLSLVHSIQTHKLSFSLSPTTLLRYGNWKPRHHCPWNQAQKQENHGIYSHTRLIVDS